MWPLEMDSVYFVVGSYGFIVHIYCTLTEGLFFHRKWHYTLTMFYKIGLEDSYKIYRLGKKTKCIQKKSAKQDCELVCEHENSSLSAAHQILNTFQKHPEAFLLRYSYLLHISAAMTAVIMWL